MIALKDNLPLLRFETGPLVEFEQAWLVRSLARAAHKAGFPNWWLAHHVAESVRAYLFLEFEGTVMGVRQLATAVQSVLQVIGYAEVAHCFEPLPPSASLSLVDFAREAGTGYELAFFEMLDRNIRDLLAARAAHLELRGLERCVKHLRARKCWSRDCETLRAEIVCFVRERVVSAALPGQEIHLTLK